MMKEPNNNPAESLEWVHPLLEYPSKSDGFSSKALLLLIGVLAITALLYAPSFLFDFTNYDDPTVLLDRERVRSLSNLSAIWTSPHMMDFFPITETSYALEYFFVQYSPMLYHVTNVVLHLACTGAVFWLAWSLGLGPMGSAIAAAVFGIHPIHVETAAWIADRKDLFAGLFGTLSILCFVKHEQKKKLTNYALGLILGIAAILSKPSAVSIGACLIVIYIALLRVTVGRAILRSLPLLGAGLAFSGLIFWMHLDGDNVRTQTFAQANQWQLALYGFAFPLWKFVWPYPLLPYYEIPSSGLTSVQAWGALATLLVLIGCAWWFRKQAWVFLGFGWYLAGILPVLRYVEVGSMSVADRYMYWPSVGLCLVLGAAIKRWWSDSPRFGSRFVAGGAAAAITLTMIGLTFFQMPAWENSDTIWSHVLKHNPHSAKAYNGLGQAARTEAEQLKKDGEQQAADDNYARSVPLFSKAIELSPKYMDAYYNRGLVRFDLGQPDQAIPDLSEVLRIQPDYAEAYFQRGNGFQQTGQPDQALQDFSRAIELKPNHAMAYNNRANVYVLQTQFDQAMTDYSKAIECDPFLSNAYANRGSLWRRKNDFQKAFADFDRAIQLDASNATAYHNRAVAHYYLKDFAKAWKDLKTVQQLGADINPGFLAAMRKAMPEPTP